MSLLMLKTKNLSWQDHTLNIEVMLAPLRSTLLLNKHKTMDTKFDQEKALYERQKQACIKDFVVEKRLIERRRQKIMKRKRELEEARSKSALDEAKDTLPPAKPTTQERTASAPSDSHGRKPTEDSQSVPQPGLPKLTLRHTPLFGGTFLRPRMFLETGQDQRTTSPEVEGSSQKDSKSKRGSGTSSTNIFVTESDSQSRKSPAPGLDRSGQKTASKSLTTFNRGKSPGLPPKPPPSAPSSENPRGISRRIPNVKFLEFLETADESEELTSNITVEVKEKTVEEKVREFLNELNSFNSRPPTACSSGVPDEVLFSSRSRTSDRQPPLVANRYSTFTMDRNSLEKAFDRYCENKTHEDLLKAMKMASKMKAHIRQARNASLMPTMATFKSSRSFMRLLKRQKRREKQETQGQ